MKIEPRVALSKLAKVLGVAGLMVTAAALVGCGDNPCQDVNDAIDAARMKPMCSDFIPASSDDGLDPSNCAVSDNQAKIIHAEVTCYEAVTKCDITGQLKLNDCLSAAMTIGASN